MKKLFTIALLILALVAAPSVSAKNKKNDEKKKEKVEKAQFRVGAKIGASISDFTWDSGLDFSNSSLVNFTGGLMGEWISRCGLGFDFGAMYIAKGSKISFEGDGLMQGSVQNTIHYIDIPVNLKYKIRIDGIENIIIPYLYAGPSFAIKVGESTKSQIITTTSNANLDIAVNAGVGVELFKHVTASVQYGWGVTKIAEIDLAGKNYDSLRSGVWSITVGFMF